VDRFGRNLVGRIPSCPQHKGKKGVYSSSWNSPQNYGMPLVNGITQCYLPPDRSDRPAFTPTGCHGNGRCLAMAHYTFSSYGRLEAERTNQFCWNLVYKSKLEPQWRSRDQILKFLKFKMADGRHVRKYSKLVLWRFQFSKTRQPATHALADTGVSSSVICLIPTHAKI